MIKDLNETNFAEEIASDKFVLVDFYAEWCGPCKMMANSINELDKENLIKIYRCDVDQCQSIALRYSISSIPTVIIFKDGTDIATIRGYLPKSELEKFIKNNLK